MIRPIGSEGQRQKIVRRQRAKAAGAEIVREPADTDYGSRDFMCRDLEGHLWSFGTYMPEAPATAPGP